MRKRHIVATAAVVLLVWAAASVVVPHADWPATPSLAQEPSSDDLRARLHVPTDYRTTFHFLGTFAVAADAGEGAKEFHIVYASPDVVSTYRATGRFPDGAVLVKEVLETETEDMTTGRVSRAERLRGWFVMVKDASDRYRDDPLWGEGWGWAWFNADSPTRTSTTDFRAECLACHVPAQSKDWIYVQGYPPLR
jgi:hypothetical protein